VPLTSLPMQDKDVADIPGLVRLADGLADL
jgi:hypothetical protein